MSENTDSIHPKLRPLDLRPILYEGQPYIFLRDPLALSEKTLIIPQPLAPLLMFLDGTRDASAVSAALAIRFGIRFSQQNVEELIKAFDHAYLLENDAYYSALQNKLKAYHEAPFRNFCCAGQNYPSEKEALTNLLDGWMKEAQEGLGNICPLSAESRMIGVVCPHIDYARGYRTYAALWQSVKPILQDVELVIIFGTDHYSQRAVLTLTRQKYATPYGALPNDEELIQRIADELGSENVFLEELHHANEHSIELALVWLHYLQSKQREAPSFNVLPILCGDLLYAEDETSHLIDRFVGVVKDGIKGRKTLVIAAADLSHVGPAFGGQPVDLFQRALIKEADNLLLALIQEGKPEEFLQAIRSINNKHNVCGVTPIYLTLKVTQPVSASLVSHEFCAADEQQTSWVSICGVALSGK